MTETEFPLEVSNVIQKGGLLQAQLSIELQQGLVTNQVKRFVSPQYLIEGINLIQIQIHLKKTTSGNYSYNSQHQYNIIFFLNISKVEKLGALKINMDFSCKELGVTNVSVKSADGLQKIYEHKTYSPNTNTFNVTLMTEIIDASGTFESLYDDSDLVDFQLHGEGGSVPVHKAVLAACSPVFKRMLAGDWKENKSGNINIPDTSRNTLDNFKRYMYLREMPQSGFQQLLLLASYYMMPGLEQKCVEQLVSRLTPQNVLNLCEFAVKNQMTKLHLAILENVQSGTVKVSEIRIVAMGNAPKKRSWSGRIEADEKDGPRSSKQRRRSKAAGSEDSGSQSPSTRVTTPMILRRRIHALPGSRN